MLLVVVLTYSVVMGVVCLLGVVPGFIVVGRIVIDGIDGAVVRGGCIGGSVVGGGVVTGGGSVVGRNVVGGCVVGGSVVGGCVVGRGLIGIGPAKFTLSIYLTFNAVPSLGIHNYIYIYITLASMYRVSVDRLA